MAQARRRLRNGVNRASGYVLGFGLLAFVVALDPWGLYSDRGDADVALNLQFCGFFATVSVLGYRLFAHPRLDIYPDHLHIVGVTRDIAAPLTAVTEVDTTSSEYVRLRIDGRFRSVPALERRNLQTLRREGVIDQLKALMPTSGSQSDLPPDSRGATRVRLSRLERNEVFLLASWIGYTVAGALLAA